MRWFKHDSDAHRDAKLMRVRMKYGMEGYGLYWHCIEIIVSGISSNSVTFELEHDAEILSHETGIHQERLSEMMTYMVNIGLFENTNGIITCLKIAKRLDQSMTSSPQMRKLIDEIRDSHDGVMIKSCKTRLDKTRLDNTKKGRFTPPTLEEVTAYCQERNNNIDPQHFIDHYEANGWMRGKNKIKSWKACVRTWESTPRGKANGAHQQDNSAVARVRRANGIPDEPKVKDIN